MTGRVPDALGSAFGQSSRAGRRYYATTTQSLTTPPEIEQRILTLDEALGIAEALEASHAASLSAGYACQKKLRYVRLQVSDSAPATAANSVRA